MWKNVKLVSAKLVPVMTSFWNSFAFSGGAEMFYINKAVIHNKMSRLKGQKLIAYLEFMDFVDCLYLFWQSHHPLIVQHQPNDCDGRYSAPIG